MNLVYFVTDLAGEGDQYPGPAGQSVSQEEVMKHFQGWEPEVECLNKVKM